MKNRVWVPICLLLLLPAGLSAAQDSDTVEAKIKTLMLDPNTKSPVVILESITDKRLLPIWIDIAEARAIALEIEHVKTPRPLTHDLLRNILNRLGATLQRAVITELRNSTYYALLHLRLKGQDLQIDARPSDAMALALKMNAPVFVSAQVFATSKAAPAPNRVGEAQLKLGVQAQDLTPELAAVFEAGVNSGVVIATVEEGSPAALAGIQRGDIITKANDNAIKSTSDLEELIRSTKPPAKIKLEVMKKGKPVTVQLDLPS
ncbi:MAG TPA: bifunctional nuclease domain-containing protein [Candidatus Binatia bacterium]|nr:bifunctional nuclease domain-containing protein [Candidatus Binatia bacterium]